MYVTAISPGGSVQVTVNVNLTNITVNTDFVIKRHIKEDFFQDRSTKTKRQSDTSGTANVTVYVYHCDEPEPNAQVYALARLNYDQDESQWAGEKLYRAVNTENEGVYHIQLSTGTPSAIAQKYM